MIKIDSLSAYARRNPQKVIKIAPEKWAKVRISIEKALMHSKSERAKAKESASKIFLNV